MLLAYRGGAAWAVLLYVIRMLQLPASGLLTHKSYQAPTSVLWVGSIVAASAGQMGQVGGSSPRGPSSSDQEKILIPLLCGD